MARTDNKKGKTVSAQQNCGRLPGWILGWMYTNALICTWDASFIMFRPHSLPGGAYSWIWYFCKYRFLFFFWFKKIHIPFINSICVSLIIKKKCWLKNLIFILQILLNMNMFWNLWFKEKLSTMVFKEKMSTLV